jgi:hypothetical protein
MGRLPLGIDGGVHRHPVGPDGEDDGHHVRGAVRADRREHGDRCLREPVGRVELGQREGFWGLTLIGERVTLISGFLLGLGCWRTMSGARWISDAGAGAGGGGGGSGGGGGGGSGTALVVDGIVEVVGIAEVSVLGAGSASEVPRKASSTIDTTNATTAIDTALTTTAAGPVRYHGAGAGLKFQVLALNASNLCASSSVGGGGSIHTDSGRGLSTNSAAGSPA